MLLKSTSPALVMSSVSYEPSCDMVEISQDQILEKLTSIFRDLLDDEEIILTRESTAQDIEEWDSLNQIKIILECENIFQVKLRARDIRNLNNVGEMVEHLFYLRRL